MSCFMTNITHISAGLVYKRCAFSKRFNTMAEPGALIFRNNTCVKKVKEKIVSKKTPLGPRKKYVRPFSKYKAHISKYVRHIFGRLKTRMNKGFAESEKCRQKQSAT